MKKRPSSSIASSRGEVRRAVTPVGDPVECQSGLAGVVKRAYVQGRSTWLGRVKGGAARYTPPTNYDGKAASMIDDLVVQKKSRNEWDILAKWLTDRGFPPETYILFQFDNLSVASRPPEPRQLASERYVEAWETSEGSIDEALEQRLVREKRTAQTGIRCDEDYCDRFMATVRVLADEGLELSPLFRYCLARMIGGTKLTAVADHFAVRAAKQFQEHKVAYAKTWASMLPEGYSAEAERLYEEWLALL